MSIFTETFRKFTKKNCLRESLDQASEKSAIYVAKTIMHCEQK